MPLAFGILGYVMIRYDYPRLTVVIALVLGGTAERNFHQAMMIGDGSWSIFTARRMSLVLIAAIVLFLALPPLRGKLYSARSRALAASKGQA